MFVPSPLINNVKSTLPGTTPAALQQWVFRWLAGDSVRGGLLHQRSKTRGDNVLVHLSVGNKAKGPDGSVTSGDRKPKRRKRVVGYFPHSQDLLK